MLQTQWLTLGLMLGSGWLMGFMLDLYRVLSRRFRLGGWAVSLVDLLYWAVSAGLVFSLLMWSNWGELRFYIFAAILIGWLAYHTWFESAARRGIEWGVHAVEQILRFFLRLFLMLVWRPVVAVGVLLKKLLVLGFRVLLWILRIPLWILSPLGRWLQPIVAPWARRLEPIFRPVVQFSRTIQGWFSGKGKDDEE
ncbi:spore cortex biosynthesis protein YabQ [Kroppenstedtia sanguinis]|uniref:Spore cortex biosynthesis protein YabQ n=1 Tax=Kroppenstedtia sanguinis TaxID=1380684 RepID=A0ABW4CBJ1_9BACL